MSPDCLVSGNPDVTGIGMRVSLYFQSLSTVVLSFVFASRNRFPPAAAAWCVEFYTTSAIILATIVQRRQISLFHEFAAFNLAYLSFFAAFIGIHCETFYSGDFDRYDAGVSAVYIPASRPQAGGVWIYTHFPATLVVAIEAGTIVTLQTTRTAHLPQNKRITIVQSGPLPLHRTYPNHFRDRIAREMRARGITFVFNDHLDQITPEEGFVTTRSGLPLRADLVISSFGARPATDFIKTLGTDTLTPSGLVRTRPTLELIAHPRVFCAGDVVDNEERNGLIKYERHAAVIVANVLSVLRSKPCASVYEGSIEVIGISMGKDGGVTYVEYLWGIILGNWFTRRRQSKELFVSWGRRRMGYDD
ncbi:hypothetical protein EW146_g3131 [Bondarzewia mesenterica]|uniref:FAD/NAD(P)-binding domain-containing protein n=1 Tax=Bondarzewia mesenterica TaxID=1095465 RepID=A0A4S4LYS3_9AGAM|nr:hypothetical protein EW146_g3131 [Bondarzewia mesenterica]